MEEATQRLQGLPRQFFESSEMMDSPITAVEIFESIKISLAFQKQDKAIRLLDSIRMELVDITMRAKATADEVPSSDPMLSFFKGNRVHYAASLATGNVRKHLPIWREALNNELPDVFKLMEGAASWLFPERRLRNHDNSVV